MGLGGTAFGRSRGWTLGVRAGRPVGIANREVVWGVLVAEGTMMRVLRLLALSGGMALLLGTVRMAYGVQHGTMQGRALARAASTGDLRAAKVLLERGAPVDRADERGMTPLMWAARRGDTRLLELLL